jgi:hypothetical protein
MNTVRKEVGMVEKRRLKRRHLIYYLRLFNHKNQQMIGHLVDITSEGIMVISEDAIPENEIYELSMTLPTDVVGKKELTFVAKSVWTRKDINPDFFNSGFVLLEVKPEDVMIIERMITEFGFKE